MKKQIFYLIAMLFIHPSLYAQEKMEQRELAVDVADHYTPRQISFLQMLDTIVNKSEQCLFRMINKDDYYFVVSLFEENRIEISMYPSPFFCASHDNIIQHYQDVKKNNKGFFYHDAKLVLVEFVGKNWYQLKREKYFSSSDCMEVISIPAKTERLPYVGMGVYWVEMAFLFDPESGKVNSMAPFRCPDSPIYSYNVQKGDTWGDLARKFATTEENIRTLNGKYDDSETPREGMTIWVGYSFEDGMWKAQRYLDRDTTPPPDLPSGNTFEIKFKP